MCPPSTITGRVRIAWLIGFLVVDAMRRHPENRTAFESQGAANSKKIFQRQRHLIGPVGMQPMVTHADSQAGTHPVEKQRNGKSVPTEHEQRGYRAEVKKAKRDDVDPVCFLP